MNNDDPPNDESCPTCGQLLAAQPDQASMTFTLPPREGRKHDRRSYMVAASASCAACDKEWSGKHAATSAAAHCDRTGHTTMQRYASVNIFINRTTARPLLDPKWPPRRPAGWDE